MPPAVRAANALRYLLGLVLLVAAMGKVYSPDVRGDLGAPGFLNQLLAGGEVLLAILLFGGIGGRALWAATLACFVSFGAISTYKASCGEESCGCFGSWHTSPRYVALLDWSVVVAIWVLYHPWHEGVIANRLSVPGAWRRLGVIAVAAGMVLFVGIACRRLMTTRVVNEAELSGGRTYVELDPAAWVGKRFPLFGHIDVGSQLARGKWTIVFYHHDCPDCRRALPGYEHSARELAERHSSTRYALVAVPPIPPPGEDPADAAPNCLRGRLDDSKKWFVTTPMVVRIDDGVVQNDDVADAKDGPRRSVPK